MKIRCEGLTDDEVYKDYHDKEWGVPLYDDRGLFEVHVLLWSKKHLFNPALILFVGRARLIYEEKKY